MSRNLADASGTDRDTGPGATPAEQTGCLGRQMAAISRGDYEPALADARDDVELHVFAPRAFNWTSFARGRAALRAALEHNSGAVELHTRTVANVLKQRDFVVVFGREQGRVRETGEMYDIDVVHRFTFNEGRLVSVRVVAAYSARGRRPLAAFAHRKTA